MPPGSQPRPLTDFGISPNITSLDAVFVWGKNRKTYFFSGDQYWRWGSGHWSLSSDVPPRYDDTYRLLDNGYPRHMRSWRGVPATIDGVVTWTDGTSAVDVAV